MRLFRFINGLIFGLLIIIVGGFVGCSEEEAVYQIEVQNRLPVPANVSFDGIQQQDVESGGTVSFSEVEEGTHILRAEASGFDPIEEFIQVDRDIIWVIEEE